MLVVRLATPTGFSDPAPIRHSSPIDVRLADVNGDGNVDAVAANLEHGSVSVLLGNGDGACAQAMTVDTGASPAWLTVAKSLPPDVVERIVIASDNAIRPG